MTARSAGRRLRVGVAAATAAAAAAAAGGAGWAVARPDAGWLAEAAGEAEWARVSAAAYLQSLARTARTVAWVVGSARAYSAMPAREGVGKGGIKAPEAVATAMAEVHRQRATKLVEVLQTNGGIYIKAGQLASSISGVPAEYRAALQALQDAVPPRPMEQVEAVLFHEFGAHSSDLFSFFEPEASAAASLAQVHRATLLSGEDVAVKVQYPGLQLAVAHDLATLRLLAGAAGWMVPSVRLGWVVDSLAESLRDEMDFQVEAAHAGRMAVHLATRSRTPGSAVTPALVPSLCSERVLTMEWVDGCKITDLECLAALGLQAEQVAELLLHVFADMTFNAGFIHGDPHAGNLLVRRARDAAKPEIVLLDHGVYVELDKDVRQSYAALWCCLLLGDRAGAEAAGAGLAGRRVGALLPLLFQPGALSREERRRLRAAHGIHTHEDVFQLIEDEMPPPLVQAIKISAMVRTIAGHLGVPSSRRLAVNASHAAALQPRWQTRWAVQLTLWAVEAAQWWQRWRAWGRRLLAGVGACGLPLAPA
eukprot:jgi/Tetstr1/430169/TSEL_020001.t1